MDVNRFIYVMENYQQLKHLVCGVVCDDEVMFTCIQNFYNRRQIVSHVLATLHWSTTTTATQPKRNDTLIPHMIFLLRAAFPSLADIHYRTTDETPSYIMAIKWRKRNDCVFCWNATELTISVAVLPSASLYQDQMMKWVGELLSGIRFTRSLRFLASIPVTQNRDAYRAVTNDSSIPVTGKKFASSQAAHK